MGSTITHTPATGMSSGSMEPAQAEIIVAMDTAQVTMHIMTDST